jgi:hypothetical protein
MINFPPNAKVAPIGRRNHLGGCLKVFGGFNAAENGSSAMLSVC